MAETVTATLRIGFGAEAEQTGANTLIAEIDTRPGGLNGGKTSFIPGDEVYILVYKSSNVTIDSAIASTGTLTFEGGLSPEIVNLSESVVFANTPDANVTRPILTIQSNNWLGNNLGGILKTGELQISLTSPPAGIYAGVNDVNYDSEAQVYRLSNTLINGISEYEIAIVFVGTAT